MILLTMRFNPRSLALAIALFLPGLLALQTTPDFSLPTHSLEVRAFTFTPEEDQLLKELVEQEPKLSWAEITKSFPRHGHYSVIRRYISYIKPNFMPDPRDAVPYTFEEDQLLKKLKDQGLTWEQIADGFAEYFPRRSGPALSQRYGEVFTSGEWERRPYTQDEDQCLEQLKRQGLKWDKIIEYFPGRTMNALQKRWSTLKVELGLGAPKNRFTPEEDQRLIQLKEQGLPWAKIAESFEGRTVKALEHRWYDYLMPKMQQNGAQNAED